MLKSASVAKDALQSQVISLGRDLEVPPPPIPPGLPPSPYTGLINQSSNSPQPEPHPD